MTRRRSLAYVQELWKISIRESVGILRSRIFLLIKSLAYFFSRSLTNNRLLIVALENMFLGQGLLWQQVWNCLSTVQEQLPSSSSLPNGHNAKSGDTLKECTARLKHTLSSLSTVDFDASDNGLESPQKRQRTSNETGNQDQVQPHVILLDEDDNTLPPDDLIDDLVEIYFANIHSWIPILHVRQFRERMAIPAQRQKLTTIFHAIVSLCVRFSEDPRLASAEVRTRYSKRSRQTVILQSMESFSVENLQALIICAFDTVSIPI